MSQINVMYVIWALETGGAEQVVATLAEGIDRERYRPMVCCLNWEGELAKGLRDHEIPIFALNKKPGIDFRVVGRLKALLKSENVDVIHTHLWTSNFWGRIAATLARTPVIVTTEHNIDVWKSPYHFALDRLLGHVTSRVVYVSDSVKAFYVDKTGIDSPKGQRIYNGIETSRFRSDVDTTGLREEFKLGPKTRVISTIGRLVPQKGHRLFVDTMERVHLQSPDVIGLIVGDGECRADLEQYIRERQMEKVVILAGLRQDIPAILNLSDIFALSSFREGFPITILEAMAVGIPCVVTDVGGNIEAVSSGITGYVTSPGDANALADPIVQLLSDDKLRVEMGRNARQRLDRLFSVQAMVEQTESLYEELLCKVAGGAPLE